MKQSEEAHFKKKKKKKKVQRNEQMRKSSIPIDKIGNTNKEIIKFRLIKQIRGSNR